MSTKANLKAAKAAIDAEDYGKAVAEAQTVLAADAQNYFARLFLARALEKQDNFDEAATTYSQAAKSKPQDSQAWLGLCSVYETQGSAKVDEYREAAVKVAEVLANADDQHRCQTTIDKLISFVKSNGTTTQYKRALEVMLPGNTIYDFLEGRIPHPSHTYTRLVEITEEEEAEEIKREIGERRTRIGARLGQVTADVKREVYGTSKLEDLYQELINWTQDDEVRRQYEEKLLDRAYDDLIVLPLEHKAVKLDQVLNLAEGMVIIDHQYRKAWDLMLETRDLDDMKDQDVNVLRSYVLHFSESGLAKIVSAWLSSERSQFPTPRKEENGDEGDDQPEDMSAEERLLLMTEGLARAEQSALAHRLVADFYLHLDEHETASETAKAGLKATVALSQQLGMSMQNTKDALNTTLATALVHYQAPRNHPEARRLFQDILQGKPRSTPVLIGLGLIFEETEDYDDAITFFTQALQQHPDNVVVGAELAWCRALRGDYEQAQQELQVYLPKLTVEDLRARDLRAQVLYRIGICIWRLDTSKTARKDRSGAYAYFLSAIKTNVNFAPAYTSLGHYYTDYAKDKKRARQCFQKAFELSPAETDAAERLAKSFADQGDWDIVEVVSQRVVDSGRARPPPGSKRKGISWPFSALGVVQMNRQEYSQAIVSFLAALRISPDDYQSYVGLGESYHNSGRYNSALRTFTHALNPPEGTAMIVNGETWFAKYMLANVHRELGDYDEAIQGLRTVLEEREAEFGVQMSLLQTFVEKAWRCLDTGLCGQAIDSAIEGIATAKKIAAYKPDAFNLWKAIGDICLLFSWIDSASARLPLDDLDAMLADGADQLKDGLLSEIDHVGVLHDRGPTMNGAGAQTPVNQSVIAGIRAYKKAIACCSHDLHAQAVAWYNLGWAEHRAHVCSTTKAGKKYLKAGVRCFKRAIELESGNAEFWNALGVVTTTLNPKVSQHAFVRSLHLNELNAKVWTNLGVLYLLHNDFEAAHSAFGRAQSTDPEYAHAWIGEGLLALLSGSDAEALNHFTHAFEISNSSSTITKQRYSLSSFDALQSSHSESHDLTRLVRPIFALQQLHAQKPSDLPCRHVAALLLERVGNYVTAAEALSGLCTIAEADYEQNESLAALASFAHAKSDLARCQLAASDFSGATENAETALDLSADEDSGLDAASRTKLRLSAHLTAGLAMQSLGKSSEAITMFRAALQESDSNPDAVCLLVKVLWSHGGKDERSVAREQLFDCVEKHPEHVGSVTLLGAIAALDDDDTTTAAIRDDLVTLRMKDGMNVSDLVEIESLLSAQVGLSSKGDDTEDTLEAQSAIMLKPDLAAGWAQLSDVSNDAYPAAMALKSVQKAVPPTGDVEPLTLATAYAGAGTVADAQRAMSLAPWDPVGWKAFSSAIV
ncbi:Superkiller protein 3 [Recurvomyces mirabilis]|uniref:Superkiller protein 3 n=1 Tax=Recurvomyces mirabilis TaxID=574656 RepID=A0AAE0WSQ8_9PEZI|nr:Superkiller protein 3 [Recurvomyces mirabilis]KAK5159584.1 Superkiller protein 3 [Recurvomyces mirabilis]